MREKISLKTSETIKKVIGHMAGLSAVISYLVAFFYASKFIASKVYDEENSNLPKITMPVLTVGTLIGNSKSILTLYNKSYALGVLVAEEFIQDSFEIDKPHGKRKDNSFVCNHSLKL